jgi:hypothetical protein
MYFSNSGIKFKTIDVGVKLYLTLINGCDFDKQVRKVGSDGARYMATLFGVLNSE